MTSPLPRLLDCPAIMAELGVSRSVAEKLMRHLPKIRLPGVRKSYVRRDDLRKLLEESTVRDVA